ncbi:hypothetical protein J6590_052060 [Homalodisca vitripennis]|nr:hypothetical protein J6590_052060 [Homalodisca vitripennis]
MVWSNCQTKLSALSIKGKLGGYMYQRENSLYNVMFFGDYKTAKVKESDICPYSENKKLHGEPITDNHRNRPFNEALIQAEAAFTKRPTHFQDEDEAPQNTNEQGEEPEPNISLTVNDIQERVQNFNREEINLQDSLTLAAEVGNALLAENSKLKYDLHNLSLENTKLASQMTEANNKNEAAYEERINDLINKNELLLTRNNSLVETIDSLEKQLENEKLLRIKLENSFEEIDREKEETLKQYEQVNRQLKQEIKDLKQNLYARFDNKGEHFSEGKEDAETQTHRLETGNNPFLVAEIAQIQIKQEKIELLIKTIQEQMNIKSDSIPKPPISIVSNNHYPLTPTTRPIKNFRTQINGEKKNIFSVSLQNAKYRAQRQTNNTDYTEETNRTLTNIMEGRRQIQMNKPDYNSTGRSIQTPTEKLRSTTKTGRDMQTPPVKPSLKRSKGKLLAPTTRKIQPGPPMTAIPRAADETIEEFYNNHIELYKKLRNDNPSIQPITNQFDPAKHFLEACRLIKFREKTGQELQKEPQTQSH